MGEQVGYVCSRKDWKPYLPPWHCPRQLAKLQKSMLAVFMKDSSQMCNSRAPGPEGNMWNRHGQLHCRQWGILLTTSAWRSLSRAAAPVGGLYKVLDEGQGKEGQENEGQGSKLN